MQAGTHVSLFLGLGHVLTPHGLLKVGLYPHLIKFSTFSGAGAFSALIQLRRPETSFPPNSVDFRAFLSTVFQRISCKCTHRLWKTHFLLLVKVFLEEVTFYWMKPLTNVCRICTDK